MASGNPVNKKFRTILALEGRTPDIVTSGPAVLAPSNEQNMAGDEIGALLEKIARTRTASAASRWRKSAPCTNH
jgi:hypothetical protein